LFRNVNISLQYICAALAVVIAISFTGQAVADEFDSVVGLAKSKGRVRVLVSGWHAITGDEEKRSFEELLGGGKAASNFQGKILQSAEVLGGTVSSVRQYRYLPLVSMEADTLAVQSIQSANPRATIWHDKVNRLSLMRSTKTSGAMRAWQKGYTGKGAIVVVLDSGVDAQHPFLRGQVIREACFSHECPNGQTEMVGAGSARPIHMHGTHVAGIIAGRSLEFTGIAPGAKIVGINIFSLVEEKLVSFDSDILAGLDYIAFLSNEEGLPISAANLSLGSDDKYKTPCEDSPFEFAATYLNTLGIVVVSASGNESHKDGLSSPSCAPAIFSVGATDELNNVVDYSNSAGFLDIVAPGQWITSANWKNGHSAGFIKLRGTSMAAPHVAGAVAVLRQADPNASPGELANALRRSGPIVQDTSNGIKKPRLNVAAALRFLNIDFGDVDNDAGPPRGDQTPNPKPLEPGKWQSITGN